MNVILFPIYYYEWDGKFWKLPLISLHFESSYYTDQGPNVGIVLIIKYIYLIMSLGESVDPEGLIWAELWPEIYLLPGPRMPLNSNKRVLVSLQVSR